MKRAYGMPRAFGRSNVCMFHVEHFGSESRLPMAPPFQLHNWERVGPTYPQVSLFQYT